MRAESVGLALRLVVTGDGFGCDGLLDGAFHLWAGSLSREGEGTNMVLGAALIGGDGFFSRPAQYHPSAKAMTAVAM